MINSGLWQLAVKLGPFGVLKQNPFESIIAFDYYDGPIEGVAYFNKNAEACYFQRKFWHEASDNSVFSIIESREAARDSYLRDLLHRKSSTAAHMRSEDISLEELDRVITLFRESAVAELLGSALASHTHS